MTTEEMMAVMQAYNEGQKIEVEKHGRWEITDEPEWNWYEYEYRVYNASRYKHTDKIKELLQGLDVHVNEVTDNFGYYFAFLELNRRSIMCDAIDKFNESKYEITRIGIERDGGLYLAIEKKKRKK